MYTQTEENILDEEVVLTEASTGKRFANYIIDLIVFYLIMFSLGIVIALIFGAEALEYEETASSKALELILSFAIYGTYYGLTEGLSKGKTLGKAITGTRAVQEDGSPVKLASAFKRGLIRLIPFEVLSAFGSPSYPWHDKWSNTLVIDEKRSTGRNESNN
ncbi:RDD family protein [Chitinophaga rhizosphaerae]|uniref:RDD family protein n=1 Tax=Chitinophaga rhizosphaerae TaxID=1864947 RepID=UPI000F812FA7|nr:RDD family protein [Chitinophaga rhizosphaerae]